MATPTVIVDDTQTTSISYEGQWMLEHGARPTTGGATNWDSQGSSGKTLFATLHALQSPGSFSFSFKGSNGRIVGTNTVQSSGSGFDPQWSCAVDGSGATVPSYVTGPRNNHVFCEWSADPGHHTVTFNVTRNGENDRPFLLDYIAYTPEKDVDLTTEHIVQYSATDPTLRYDSSWTKFGSDSMRSGGGGSSFTFSFRGAGIQLLGEVPGDLVAPDASATYTLDNGKPTTFSIVGNTQAGPQRTNQRYFETLASFDGSHNITITYAGNATTTPLIVSSLIVHRQLSNSWTPPYQAEITRPIPVGAIVGLVVGLLVLILAAFLLWRLLWRNQKPKEEENGVDPLPNPSTSEAQPGLLATPGRVQTKERLPSAATTHPTPSTSTSPGPSGKRARASSLPPLSSLAASGSLPAIQEVRHAEDSGLRIVDGVVTSATRPTILSPS